MTLKLSGTSALEATITHMLTGNYGAVDLTDCRALYISDFARRVVAAAVMVVVVAFRLSLFDSLHGCYAESTAPCARRAACLPLVRASYIHSCGTAMTSQPSILMNVPGACKEFKIHREGPDTSKW